MDAGNVCWKIPMAKNSIDKKEPRFLELQVLYDKHKSRRTKAEIFRMWEKIIAPDKPKISLNQFVNFTRTLKEREFSAQVTATDNIDIERIMTDRAVTLVQIEEDLRSVTGDLVGEAKKIMDINKEDGVQLKERYFALTVVDKVWDKIQKEKNIAIKAHAEKRESVGMFAKLLRGAMSGEFTMKDVEVMRQTYGTTDKTITGTEGAAQGAA